MNRFTIIILSFFFILPVFSQETNRELTLQNVIQLAIEQSPNAVLAKHKFRSSYWHFRSYKAGMLPSLTLDADLLNFNNSYRPITQPDGTIEYKNNTLNNTGLNLTLNQSIGLTGGNFFVSSGIARQDDFSTDTKESSYMTTPLLIGYSQPAFQYNSYKWEKKIEPLKYAEAKKEYIYQLEILSEQAINYFYNLATAQLNVEIDNDNYHNNDTIYKIAQGRYNIGTIAENELLQLELAFLNAKSSLSQSKINFQISMFRLRSFLGFNELVRIKLKTNQTLPDLEISLNKAIDKANANSGELIAYKIRLIEAERDVAKAKAENRFNANLFASYGLNQSANLIGDAYRNPDNQQQVNVGIRIPILDWGKGRGKYKMSQSNQEVVRTQIEQSRIDFKQRVMLKVLQFNEQDNLVLIASKADTIARKRYEVTKQRFLIGKISVLDLNIASSEKDVAQRNNLRAQKTYWTYYFNIRQFTLYDFINDIPLETVYDDLVK